MTTTIETAPQATMGHLRRLFYRGPATGELYNEYACQRRIDHAAPITACREVIIDAPVARVWELLTELQGWGDVDPDITDVHIADPVKEGTRFSWRNGRTRMTSRFAVVDENRELTWTGAALSAKVVHRHVLTDLGDNTSRLVCEESMAGPLLVLLYSSAKLDAALQKWMTAISTAARP